MEPEIEKLIDLPPPELMGPVMRRLNPKQQRFVCALTVTGGDQAEAYVWAGYTANTNASARACASRLAAHEDIKEAIREEALRRIDCAAIAAVSVLVEIASPRSTAKASDRLKAAEMILDRTGFHGKTEHKIVIKDERTTADLLAFIRETAGRVGLDPKALLAHQPVLEAEFSEVPAASAEGLEDLFD